MRKHSPFSGRRPLCKGCGEEIQYADQCIRYCRKKRDTDKFFETDQYHCKVECIKAMSDEDYTKFMAKKWTDKAAQEVQTILAKEESE